MRLLAPAGGMVIVAGLAVFWVGPGERAAPTGAGPAEAAEPAVAVGDRALAPPDGPVTAALPVRREALVEAGPSGPRPEVASAEPAPPREGRRRFRRNRNRYPGPIPTPADWRPPEGPVRIALQAGHWRADEAPGELNGLRDGGTRWRGTAEWEVNLEIARAAGALLEEKGYEVDILPAVVPPGYRAHLFISIHADGSNDPRATGYRVAPPRQDATGRAAGFATLLEERYGEATGLGRLPTVTRRMQNYYAFNFRRYEHALHPMTIGVILETGFLTSARDREVIVSSPEVAARGIVDAVEAFEVTRLPEAAASSEPAIAAPLPAPEPTTAPRPGPPRDPAGGG